MPLNLENCCSDKALLSFLHSTRIYRALCLLCWLLGKHIEKTWFLISRSFFFFLTFSNLCLWETSLGE